MQFYHFFQKQIINIGCITTFNWRNEMNHFLKSINHYKYWIITESPTQIPCLLNPMTYLKLVVVYTTLYFDAFPLHADKVCSFSLTLDHQYCYWAKNKNASSIDKSHHAQNVKLILHFVFLWLNILALNILECKANLF